VRSPAAANPLSGFEGAQQPKRRAGSRARNRGNQGLIVGVLGCCLAFLGIFTLGLVFVPIAVLFSLIGLISGLAYRATTGILAGIGGLTLSAIGFVSSPALMLASGILVASQISSEAPVPTVHPVASQANTSQLPQPEQRFCDITSVASDRYFDLASDLKRAGDEKNGVKQKRAEEAMTKTRQDRDAEILKLARESNFKIDDWGVQLLKVGSPTNKRVTFSVRPLCSSIVTVHLTATPNDGLLEALAVKRAGDAFRVSGTFAGSRTDTDDPIASPEAGRLELSITERGSMQEPEYFALLK
jgi:hypothetical protein